MTIAHFSSVVVAAGVGAPAPVYTLSGTAVSPNQVTALVNDPADCYAAWEFRANGTVVKDSNGQNTQFRDGVEWTDEQNTPTVDMWIRSTYYSGDVHTTGPTNGTIYVLHGSGEADRIWRWDEDSILETYSGEIKIDIATDSGMSNIVAFGYYFAQAQVDFG